MRTRAAFGLSWGFPKYAWGVRTWRHRCPGGPLGIGNMFQYLKVIGWKGVWSRPSLRDESFFC